MIDGLYLKFCISYCAYFNYNEYREDFQNIIIKIKKREFLVRFARSFEFFLSDCYT